MCAEESIEDANLNTANFFYLTDMGQPKNYTGREVSPDDLELISYMQRVFTEISVDGCSKEKVLQLYQSAEARSKPADSGLRQKIEEAMIALRAVAQWRINFKPKYKPEIEKEEAECLSKILEAKDLYKDIQKYNDEHDKSDDKLKQENSVML